MSADAGQEVLHADDIHVLNVNAQLQENRFSKKKKLRTVGLGFIPDVHHRRHMKTPNEKLKALQI